MAEELDIGKFLEYFQVNNLPTLARILLSTDGTVQTLLSIIHNAPVVAVVKSQDQNDIYIRRETSLMAGEKEVCSASSKIPLSYNDSKVLDLVRAKELGLGQIAKKLKIPTAREIKDMGLDSTHYFRTYQMQGQGLLFIITERFPRELLG